MVGLNWWLLGLKWWVVLVVARFRLVMVAFDGGHLDVGWVSRWRLGFWDWVTMEIGLWVMVEIGFEIGFLGLGYGGDQVMGHDVA